MKDRLKKLRKALDLTQTEFADRIGSVQNTITGYESGRRIPSNLVISSICREFNVNEEWLRTGIGEMFNPAPNSELDALAEKYGLSHGAYVLIEKFLNLKKEQQDVIIDFVKAAAADLIDRNLENETSSSDDLDIEAEVEAYRRALELQKKAKGESSASSIIGGVGKGEKVSNQ